MNSFRRKLALTSIATAVYVICAAAAWATPSTQIWIPSTDIQKKGTFHLGIDNCFTKGGSSKDEHSLPTDVGISYGLLGYAELGIDYLGGTSYDPLYFNFKAGLPESSNIPALAIGGYSFGTDTGGADATDYNIIYALAAKTIGPLGRFSLGYYTGNKDLLVDDKGDKENSGILLSWDRTISEISDKLWAAVDYQGGDNSVGALSLGISWAFSENTSVIFGYMIPNDKDVFGGLGGTRDMITTQLDINF